MLKRRTSIITVVLLFTLLLLPLSSAHAYTVRYTYRYTSSGWQLVSAPVQQAIRITYTYYRVQAGDTLNSISQRFNTTVAELKQLNRISGDIVQPGQLLLILMRSSQSTPAPQPAPPAPAPPQPAPPAPAPPVSGLTQAEQQMLNLVNQERTGRGLRSLQADLELTRLARLKSQDMINLNYFAHQSPTYGSPFDMMRAAGVTYRTAGENLAGAASVERAHTALMNSPGHRANILNPNYTHIGIGAITGGRYGMMFTQMFVGR